MTGEQPCQQESGQSDEDSNHSAVLGQHLGKILGGLFASPDGVPHGGGEDSHQEHDMLSPSRVPFQGHNISFFLSRLCSVHINIRYVQKYLK